MLPARIVVIAPLVGFLAAVASAPARAQKPAPADTVVAHPSALGGGVRDQYGHPLRAAVIHAAWLDRSAIVDDSGRFLLRGLPPGKQHFTAMRIGYSPVEFNAELPPDSTVFVDIRLQAVVNLPTVTTQAKLTGRSALLDGTGFYDRQAKGAVGFFIAPEAIAAMPWAMYPAQFLDGVPRVRIVKKQMVGSHGAQLGSFGYDIRFPAAGATAGGATTCSPSVFIDGVFTRLSADDAVSAPYVYAIEVYVDGSLLPSEFQPPMPNQHCGALVIWTKKYAPPGTP